MATTPVPTPADVASIVEQALVALKASPSVSLTTDIGAVANCIAKLCDLAMTPQGQATLAQWRSDSVSANNWIANAATKVSTWFGGLLK
jgi:hypothetical protein